MFRSNFIVIGKVELDPTIILKSLIKLLFDPHLHAYLTK